VGAGVVAAGAAGLDSLERGWTSFLVRMTLLAAPLLALHLLLAAVR
jgi:hypothetical protein